MDDHAALTTWLENPEIAKVGHGVKGIMHALAGSALSCESFTCCTEVQAYLLHPERRSYDFADLVNTYLGVSMQLENQGTLGILADGTLAANESLETAAVQVLDLADVLDLKLAQVGQNESLVSLETELSLVLFRMEDRGIVVDTQKLQELHDEFATRVAQAEHFAHAAIDDDSVNLASPKQLQGVLFERLQLPKTKKTKSGYTTNAEALAGLLTKISGFEDENSVRGQEFLNALMQHRDAVKLLQSVEGLQKAVQADGRIRTTYQQTVTATGRLSSTEPNLQNIHARTEAGQQIREVFVPGEGFEALLTADYSQIEMRLMAHLSRDAELISAFCEGADLHRYVASQVFEVPEAEVSAAQRSKIKAMSYGLVYGLSAYGLSAQLHISVSEAQELMDGYFSRFGKVKEYLDSLVVQARKSGYTQTILGRRRYLPDLLSDNRQIRQAAERAALNAPIQGSAADLIKLAMLATEFALHDAGLKSRVLLQVHDELVLEVAAGESAQVREIVAQQMGQAYALSVPLTVGIGEGKNWRAAAH
ncbi:DNA polymerase [Arcanobacterium hippocoleae]|uniref:DNA polymerase n=1 Tax=Arcanobacterium hippocoleae TaxID=149017 RepID=UPI003340DC82